MEKKREGEMERRVEALTINWPDARSICDEIGRAVERMIADYIEEKKQLCRDIRKFGKR